MATSITAGQIQAIEGRKPTTTAKERRASKLKTNAPNANTIVASNATQYTPPPTRVRYSTAME